MEMKEIRVNIEKSMCSASRKKSGNVHSAFLGGVLVFETSG